MSKVRSWIDAKWDQSVEYIRYRSIFVGSLHIDQERHDASFQGTFESAKRTSDFVGMILRLSFLSLVSSVFLIKAQREDGAVSYVYSICWAYSLGLFSYLGMKVGKIILLYLARDIPKHSRKSIRFILAIIAVATHLIIIIGIYSMMYDLSKHNTFFQAMTRPESAIDVLNRPASDATK